MNRKFASFLVFLLGFSSAVEAVETARLTYAAEPAWVNLQQLPELQEPRKNIAGEIILLDQQYDLGEQQEKYIREVSRALSAVGLREVSEIRLRYNPEYQELVIHRINIIRDGHVIDITKTGAIRELQREEQLDQGLQDGQITVLISASDIRVGDLVDLSYSIKGINPIFDNHKFGLIGLNGGWPIDLLKVRINTPTSMKLFTHVHGDEHVKIQSEASRGGRVYLVKKEKVAQAKIEQGSPAWRNGYSWLEFSDYPDWARVARWGESIYKVDERETPLLNKLYESLSEGSVDKESFVTKALSFVQHDIRYLGLEFGVNSHKPHHPEEVLTRRFGDCKDKALLLVTLLRRHGISAAPALVSTEFGEGLRATLPAPSAFDHVISRVIVDNRVYWLDATRMYQSGDLRAIGKNDYGYALVLEPASTGLVDMYQQYPMDLEVEVEEHYYIDDFSKPAKLEVRTTYQGNAAERWRYHLSNNARETVEEGLVRAYAAQFDRIEISAPLRFEDQPDENKIVTYETYSIDGYIQRTDNRLSANVNLVTFFGQMERPKEAKRQYPFLISAPRKISNRTYIHYPVVTGMKEPMKVFSKETPAFRYNAVDRYMGKTYQHQAELEILKPWIDPEEIEQFNKSYREIMKEWEFSIGLPVSVETSFEQEKALAKQMGKSDK